MRSLDPGWNGSLFTQSSDKEVEKGSSFDNDSHFSGDILIIIAGGRGPIHHIPLLPVGSTAANSPSDAALTAGDTLATGNSCKVNLIDRWGSVRHGEV